MGLSHKWGLQILRKLEELPMGPEGRLRNAINGLSEQAPCTSNSLVERLSEVQPDMDKELMMEFSSYLVEEDGEYSYVPSFSAHLGILLLANADERQKIQVLFDVLREAGVVVKDAIMKSLWRSSKIFFFAIKSFSRTGTRIPDKEGIFSIYTVLADAVEYAFDFSEEEFLDLAGFHLIVVNVVYNIIGLAVETSFSSLHNDSHVKKQDTDYAQDSEDVENFGERKSSEKRSFTSLGLSDVSNSKTENSERLPLEIKLGTAEKIIGEMTDSHDALAGSSTGKIFWQVASDIGLRMFCISCGKIMFVTAILGADAAICIFLFTSGAVSLAAAIAVGVGINAFLGSLAFFVAVRYLKRYETPTIVKQAQGLIQTVQNTIEQRKRATTKNEETGVSLSELHSRKTDQSSDFEESSIDNDCEMPSPSLDLPSPSVNYNPRAHGFHRRESESGAAPKKSWISVLVDVLLKKALE